MRLRAILILIATLAFAVSPFLVPDFGGYDPTQFPVPMENPPVQPAGYAFAIWGLIYLYLLLSAIYGLVKRSDDPHWDGTRIPLLISLGVGAVWLPVALQSPIWATVLIWVMLASALAAQLRTTTEDRVILRGPIGLYSGWLTAASAVSVGLIAAGWGLPPFGPEGWAIVALSLGLVIAVVMIRLSPSPAYVGAVIWALVGVLVANGFNAVGLFTVLAILIVIAWSGATLYRRLMEDDVDIDG